MNRAFLASVVLFLLIGVMACNKSANDPKPQAAKVTDNTITNETFDGIITFPAIAVGDTSNTLVSYTSLVGEWNLVSDTVSFGTNRMYHGKPGDSYRFTKYGNLYITYDGNAGTSVYGMQGNKIEWGIPQIDENGVNSGFGTRGVFEVTEHTATSLVLTQSAVTTMGSVYEQITLKKAK